VSPDLGALLRGQEADPFRWLGPHLDRDRVASWCVVPSRGGVGRPAAATSARDDAADDAQPRSADCSTSRSELARRCDGGIDYRFHVRFESGVDAILDDPYRFGRVISDYDLHLFGEGTSARSLRPPRLASDDARRSSMASTSGLGAERAARLDHRRLQRWDGRVHPMRRLVPSGVWELFIPDLAEVRLLQVRVAHERRTPAAQDRSVRPVLRGAAAIGRDRLPTSNYAWGTRVDGGARSRASAGWIGRW
jgi:1,4-alpha-glucan branching enzyme